MYVPEFFSFAGVEGARVNQPGIRRGALGHDHGQANGVNPATQQPSQKAGS